MIKHIIVCEACSLTMEAATVSLVGMGTVELSCASCGSIVISATIKEQDVDMNGF